jgi:hypothetical protein
MGEKRDVYRVLMTKTEGNSPLGRSKYRWDNNIEMDLQKVGYGGMDWTELAHDKDR